MDALTSHSVSRTSSRLSSSSSDSMDQDGTDNVLCTVLDILNFSPLPNTTYSKNEPDNNELISHNIVLTRDLFIAREENAELVQQVSVLSRELECLQKKDEEREKMLQEMKLFSRELQHEIGMLAKNLSCFLKGGKNGKNYQFHRIRAMNFLLLLDKLSEKIPSVEIADWSSVQKLFSRLNGLLTKKGTKETTMKPSTKRSVVQKDANNDNCTLAYPPVSQTVSRDSNEGTKDQCSDNDIEILEENIVVRSRTEVQVASTPDCEKLRSCGLCGNHFSSAKILLEHIACSHNGCMPCHRLFESASMLAHHIETYHYPRVLSSSQSSSVSEQPLQQNRYGNGNQFIQLEAGHYQITPITKNN